MAQSTCSVLDCTVRSRTRGWCQKHYRRWQKHGDPDITQHAQLPLLARFRLRYIVDANGCWLWPLSGSQRYGQLTINGRTVMAHRLAFELLVGPIP